MAPRSELTANLDSCRILDNDANLGCRVAPQADVKPLLAKAPLMPTAPLSEKMTNNGDKPQRKMAPHTDVTQQLMATNSSIAILTVTSCRPARKTTPKKSTTSHEWASYECMLAELSTKKERPSFFAAMAKPFLNL